MTTLLNPVLLDRAGLSPLRRRLDRYLIKASDEKMEPMIERTDQSSSLKRTARAIILLEGENDAEFMKRVSAILHDDDFRIPNLESREKAGEIIFVPIGGSNFVHWTQRLAGLGLPEFHILDHEISPLTEERQRAADIVNRRPGCRAVLTGKRAMENYLSPEALRDVRGLEIAFGDLDDVPLLAAQRLLELAGGPDWSAMPARSRRRLKDRAKAWLNKGAASRMTVARLNQRDPAGEIRAWLLAIAEMADYHG